MKFLWKSQVKRGEKGIRKPVKKARRTQGEEPRQLRWLLWVLWLLLFGTLLYALIFSSFLRINHIHISGTQSLESRAIEAYVREDLSGTWLRGIPKNNFLLLPLSRLDEKLSERFPLIRELVLDPLFPNSLAIELQERRHLVLWCSGGPCYLIHENGRAEESQRSLTEENQEYQIRIIDTSAQAVRQGQILFDFDLPAFTAEIEPLFRDRLNLEVGGTFEASSRFAEELRLRTNEGYQIYISTEIPLEKTISDLGLLFEKELPADVRTRLEYIDARTENRLYFRLTGEAPVEVPDEAVQDSATQSGGEDKEEVKKDEKKKKND